MRPVDVNCLFHPWKPSNFGSNPAFPWVSRHSKLDVFTGETKSIERFEESRGSDDCQRPFLGGRVIGGVFFHLFDACKNNFESPLVLGALKR